MRKTIALLFHERHSRGRRRIPYTIYPLARCWEEAGHKVVLVFGVEKFVPADLAILHVDLSVVPDEYLAFASRYPIVLNGRVKDIRKSTFSGNIVRPGDPYNGRVIVKSDLNYAGLPERMLAEPRRSRGSRLLAKLSRRFRSGRPAAAVRSTAPRDYRIYDRPGDVPRASFEDDSFVVEKFLPEIENGLYRVRNFQFLGDRATCVRIASPHPIVKSDSKVSREVVEPHPEIVARREALGFDYGKFDYVIHEGQPVLLDVNKTPGDSPTMDEEVRARVRYRAAGLNSYFA